MAGSGGNSLGRDHPERTRLEEYVLGQLLPADEDAVRRHLDDCARCRAAAADFRALCRQIAADIAHELDTAQPASQLRFDAIASQWRKPPRRFRASHTERTVLPNLPLAALLLLLVAFALLFPTGGSAALRGLFIASDYVGPPVVVAASTPYGLVVARFIPDRSPAMLLLPSLRYPTKLRFAPGGTWLALHDNASLHLIEVRSAAWHLELAVGNAADWAWSPDGRWLAYTDGAGQLAVFDSRSRAVRVLAPSFEAAWGLPVWSPDSTAIAYAAVPSRPFDGSSPVAQGLWRVDVQTGFRVELARRTAAERVLVPAAWLTDGSVLVACDFAPAIPDELAIRYRLDLSRRTPEPLPGSAAPCDGEFTWSVSMRGQALAISGAQLAILDVGTGTLSTMSGAVGWPLSAEWSPSGDWLALVQQGAASGRGLRVYAPGNGSVRALPLPGGAVEQAVMWVGSEHLMVIRQPEGTAEPELWLVGLYADPGAQRLLAQVRLPEPSPLNGWQWQDVVAVQALTSE